MTSTSNSKDVADTVSDIVAEVFISTKMYGICLPASLMLLEQLTKLKLNPNINMGRLSYEGRGKGCPHVWVSIGDRIIDPTLKISKTLGVLYLSDSESSDYQTMDFAKFKYHPGEEKQVVDDEESTELLKMYKYLKQSDDMLEAYFKMAPKKLNVIRNVINYKVDNYFKS